MKITNKTKQIFFFLTFLILIQFISVFTIQFAKAETSSVISGANLNINYSGLPLESSMFHIETGNRRYIRHTTLETIDLGNDTFQFNALFTFGWETNFYTTIKASDVFIDQGGFNQVNKVNYITINSETSWADLFKTSETYSFNYNSYNMSRAILNPIVTQLSTKVGVSANYIPSNTYSYNLEKSEFSLTTTPLVAQTQRIRTMDSSIQKIAEYNDVIYTNTLSNLVKISDFTTPSFSDDLNVLANDKLSTLGFFPLEDKIYEGKLSSLYQDSYRIAGIPYHQLYQVPTIGQDDLLTNTMALSIQPDIYLIKQAYNIVTGGTMKIDTAKEWIFPVYGIITSPNYSTINGERTVGWHIQNYNGYVSQESDVVISTIANFKVNSGYEQALLIPTPQLSTLYWNAIVTGQGIDIALNDTPFATWVYQNQLTLTIIGIIVVVVVIAVVYFYLRTKFPALFGSRTSGPKPSSSGGFNFLGIKGWWNRNATKNK
jgi:hypothetical protein